MAICTTHPEVDAERACDVCQYPFCGACLVEIQGRRTCAYCKGGVLADLQNKGQEHVIANEALIWALLSPLCGLIFGVLGLNRSIQALRMIDAGDRSGSRSRALAALFLSGFSLLAWVGSLLLVLGLTVAGIWF